jgi:hypothetical protein
MAKNRLFQSSFIPMSDRAARASTSFLAMRYRYLVTSSLSSVCADVTIITFNVAGSPKWLPL